MQRQRPPRRPTMKVKLAGFFGEIVQWDLFFHWDLIFLLMIDSAISWKVVKDLIDKMGPTTFWAMLEAWFRYFGPPRILEPDQEGDATSDWFTYEAERLSITLRFKGSQGHTGTGLAERHIQLVEVAALKTFEDTEKYEFKDVRKQDIVIEVAMGQITLWEYDGYSPNQALFGSNLRGLYELECPTIAGNEGAAKTTPEFVETSIRLRQLAKFNTLRAVWEDRLAKAHKSRAMQLDLSEMKPKGTPVDLFRQPERKDESGWRGPCDLLDIETAGNTAVVKSQDFLKSFPFVISGSTRLA